MCYANGFHVVHVHVHAGVHMQLSVLTCTCVLVLQQGADMECLKALIAFGANINLRNSFGQTPLDVASMSPIGTQYMYSSMHEGKPYLMGPDMYMYMYMYVCSECIHLL